MRSKSRHRKHSGGWSWSWNWFFGSVAIIVVIIGILGSIFYPASVDITTGGFSDSDLSISNTRMQIHNTMDVQVLVCLGKFGDCDRNASGPDELHAPGYTLKPGETKEFDFADQGDYAITIASTSNSKFTNLNLQVSYTEPSSGSD